MYNVKCKNITIHYFVLTIFNKTPIIIVIRRAL